MWRHSEDRRSLQFGWEKIRRKKALKLAFCCRKRRNEPHSAWNSKDRSEPPTPKMSSQEKLALTPALSPREREQHPESSEIFMLLGAALPHGDLRRLLPFYRERITAGLASH